MKILQIVFALSFSAFAVPTNIAPMVNQDELVSITRKSPFKYLLSKLPSLENTRSRATRFRKQVRFDIPSEQVAVKHVDQYGKISFAVPSKKGQTKVPARVLDYLPPKSYPIKVAYNLDSENAEFLDQAYKRLKIDRKIKPESHTPILKAPTLDTAQSSEKEQQYAFYDSLKRAFRRRKRRDRSDNTAMLDVFILGRLLELKYGNGEEFDAENERLLQLLLTQNGYHKNIVS